ncbi:MAG: threonylcarbamoyl-AMP synthase [Microbacteriaceae bacterium]|nr:threonylcarbamoyl-AMP synthase [Microbacteriaceae bacterium]
MLGFADVSEAAKAIKDGYLVAFPTETVYGLGADAINALAVDRIFEVKGRPRNHPLIVHITSAESLDDWAKNIPDYAYKLAKDFWPGPMTLVLERSELVKDFITGSQNTVGLRVPRHPVARDLLLKFAELGGRGIAAPSANLFGKVSPTVAADVQAELAGRLIPGDLILDGGSSEVGVESTIIDCTKSAPAILRPGAITASMVQESTGLTLLERDETIRVSGSLKSHYAPKAKVLIDQDPISGDGLIALASYETPTGVIRLASPKDNYEYAQQLYAALREADRLGLMRVVAVLPEGDDIAVAVRDRLRRSESA